jgi:hypothetical protein
MTFKTQPESGATLPSGRVTPNNAGRLGKQPVNLLQLVTTWHSLKADESRIKKELEKLKPSLLSALGKVDAIGVSSDKGTYVVQRRSQDRRKPDLVALWRVALGRTDIAPSFTETRLTEEGAALLLEQKILTPEDLQAALVGIKTEYAEVKFEPNEAPEDAGA